MSEFQLEPETVESVRAFSVSESPEEAPKRTVRTFAGLDEGQVLHLRSKARRMRNKIVVFRPDPDGPLVYAGHVTSAKLVGRDEETGIPDLEVKVTGRTGSELTLSLVRNYVRIVKDYKEAKQWTCYKK